MINQIELSEQFEKIFTDKEVNDFYEQWRTEKNKKEETFWEKNIGIFSLVFIASTISALCLWVYWMDNGVHYGTLKLHNGEVFFYTEVKVNGEIAKLWTVPAASVTDSIKTVQYNEAKKLYKTLK